MRSWASACGSEHMGVRRSHVAAHPSLPGAAGTTTSATTPVKTGPRPTGPTRGHLPVKSRRDRQRTLRPPACHAGGLTKNLPLPFFSCVSMPRSARRRSRCGRSRCDSTVVSRLFLWSDSPGRRVVFHPVRERGRVVANGASIHGPLALSTDVDSVQRLRVLVERDARRSHSGAARLGRIEVQAERRGRA